MILEIIMITMASIILFIILEYEMNSIGLLALGIIVVTLFYNLYDIYDMQEYKTVLKHIIKTEDINVSKLNVEDVKTVIALKYEIKQEKLRKEEKKQINSINNTTTH